jgi:hypothetical protein
MPGKWPWFERGFTFDFPAEKCPDIIERLRGTPARVEELIRNIPTDVLTRRDGEAWSIQENVGHLGDVEPLWAGRIDDILGGAEVMRPADLSNTRTHDANHNARPLSDVAAGFRSQRMDLISRLESLADGDFARLRQGVNPPAHATAHAHRGPVRIHRRPRRLPLGTHQ